MAAADTLAIANTARDARRESLSRALARVSGAQLRAGNHLTLLRDGPDTYADWLRAIAGAQRWVHLENYIFKSDTIGRQFADALAERAAAGVAVRVLVDWYGSADVPGSFWRKLRRAGVDVRLVNPPRLTAPLNFFQRDHRKSLGVDGVYASLGGVCIADPWLARSPDTNLPYRDTCVSVRGPAIADIELAFADVWDGFGVPLPSEEQPRIAGIAPADDVDVRVIVQEPGKLRIQRVLELMIAASRERLWISDAYFLAMPSLTQALLSAAQDGLDVRILLPATNDLPLVGALSRTGYRQLLESGVRIWEYSGLMMHAKTTVADGWWGRVGSTNLNITGLVTNWEIDLVAEDERFARQLEVMFEDDLSHAREVRLMGTARKPRIQTARRISGAERRLQRTSPGSRSQAVAVASRVGRAAIEQGDEPLYQHERWVSGWISAGVLLLSLVSARYPRLLGWPLAAIGALLGGLGVARAVRPSGD